MHRKPRVAVMLDLEWPYKRHVGVFVGTQRYARERGWDCVIDEFVNETLSELKTSLIPYDGVIARVTDELAETCHTLRIPLVNVWSSSPATKRVPGVFPDFAIAGRLRAEHLLVRGFDTFAALVSRSDLSHRIEFEAFRETVEGAGFTCVAGDVPLRHDTHAQWKVLETSISQSAEGWRLPVGVYVGCETVGRIVVQMCEQRGWRVPEDVAIVTGMNEEIICENPRPSLTSVEFGYDRIGYEAARLLGKLMSERGRGRTRKAKHDPQHIKVPPVGLVLRESTDFYAVDEPSVAAAIQFVAASSHQKIGPGDVAQAVSVELRTLQRRFRKHLTRSIAEEIQRVRLERAKRELAVTDQPIGAIAKVVGFGGHMRMYHAFNREVGLTPNEYRRQRRSN